MASSLTSPAPPNFVTSSTPTPTPTPTLLVAQLGREVTSSLNRALDRLRRVSAAGHVEPPDLRALRSDIHRAHRIGRAGQALGTVAAHPSPAARDRVDLSALLRDAVRARTGDLQDRHLAIGQAFAPVSVLSDAPLLSTLVEAVLDWSCEHAVSALSMRLQGDGPAPGPALLQCRFDHAAASEADTEPLPLAGGRRHPLDTVSWRLTEQLCHLLGLLLQRDDRPGHTCATLTFESTLPASGEAAAEPAPTGHAPALAGRHVLVVAARRDVRALVRDALKPMGLMLDFVASVDDAGRFVDDVMPHAVVHDASLSGERFGRLQARLRAGGHRPAFVNLPQDGRDRIASELPGALRVALRGAP